VEWGGRACHLSAEQFDAIFVDEAQDIRSTSWTSIELLLRDEASILALFYDPEQNVFNTKLDFPLKGPEIELNVNCRNPQNVFEHLKKFYGEQAMRLPSFSIQGKLWEITRSPSEVLAYLETQLKKLFESGIRAHQIVLPGRHLLGNTELKGLSKLGGYTLSDDLEAWFKDKSILYSTYKAFKGLEADYVFMLEVIDPCERFTENVFMNGVSRTRHQLHIVHTHDS
jgi:superfamily I DNA/RNA helicase